MSTFSDGSMGLLTPDAVLPAQHCDSRFAPQPERRLLVAILEDALATASRNGGERRRRSPGGDARAWVFSDDVTWPFSYVNICGVLGIDPHYLRRSLLSARRPVECIRFHSGSRTRVSMDRGKSVSQAS